MLEISNHRPEQSYRSDRRPEDAKRHTAELLHVPSVAPDLLIADHLPESSDPVTPTTESEDAERG